MKVTLCRSVKAEQCSGKGQYAAMTAVFSPSANTFTKFSLLAIAALAAGGTIWWWFWPRMDYRRHTSWTVEQPVPFSHKHHVSGLGIDCRFCHTTVEVAGNAGMPPTYTCMTCHSQIWTGAAILEPVRQSLATDTPLQWHRITDLPDYVYFNHAVHIAKGVGCAECHGQVEHMPLMYKAKSLTMGFCLNCHADPGPRLRPRDELFNLDWQRGPRTPSPATLMADYHIGSRRLTDCSICHR
jgi:hypothetical protein